MHNGLLADPTNPIQRQVKEITSKGSKKMTDADYERVDQLKWEGGCYWSEEVNGFVIPSDNIERCIQEGAKKNRLGKDFAAAVLCVQVEVKIDHELAGKSMDAIYKDARYTLRKGVRIQKNRVIGVRPKIPVWSIEFDVEFDERIVNAGQVEKAMREAGSLVGLGDWRPKYGRFEVEVAS